MVILRESEGHQVKGIFKESLNDRPWKKAGYGTVLVGWG